MGQETEQYEDIQQLRAEAIISKQGLPASGCHGLRKQHSLVPALPVRDEFITLPGRQFFLSRTARLPHDGYLSGFRIADPGQSTLTFPVSGVIKEEGPI